MMGASRYHICVCVHEEGHSGAAGQTAASISEHSLLLLAQGRPADLLGLLTYAWLGLGWPGSRVV